MKHYHFLPVFITLLASYLGLHFYAARWFVKSFALSPASASWLRAVFLLASFFAPFTMYLKRHWPAPELEPLYSAGYAWMGIILLAAFVFACSDLAAALLRARGAEPVRLAQSTLAALLLTLAWAFYGGTKEPALKEVVVALKELPPALEGYRIAQLSDLHIDSAWKVRRFAAAVAKVNSARPDLVLVTGDFIDSGFAGREELAAAAAAIRSRHGVYGSAGNHEYYYGLEKALACYRACAVKPLVNEAADVGDLRLIGLGDIHTEQAAEADVKKLLEKHKTGKFTVIMSHQPVYYELMAETGNYLVFSGHTHKGQLFPFHIFSRLFYRYFYGLYRIRDSFFYVTSGAGTWGPAMRWLAPAEIPIITLKRAYP